MGRDREAFLLGLAAFVIVVWAIAVIVQVALPSHPVPTEVHAITFAIVTGLFGGAALSGRKNGKDNGS